MVSKRNEALGFSAITMKKILFVAVACSTLFTSCMKPFSSLKSTTSIKANESFVLGNNQHKMFSVKLKNVSPNSVVLWQAPLDGGQHSPLDVQPNETVKLKVERNTALRIENKAQAPAVVELLVKGDTGLSMGYKGINE